METPESADQTQTFFETRQAAAVLKHAILERYLPPFGSKTGSSSDGNRVAIVDGYAGAGRYEDGSPGSPAIITRLADQKALQKRKIEAYFVESDPSTFRQLQAVLQQDAGGLEWKAWQGNLEDHLTELLRMTIGVPLFLFLDPYGHGLGYDTIMDLFESRPAPQPYAPATETLIRIDSRAIWRTRGAARRDDYPGRASTLARLDQTAGGRWWRDDDPGMESTEEYLDWFSTQLLRRACQRLHCSGWTVDVQQKPDKLPVYYLLFLTRNPAGMDTFSETLSNAMEVWRRRILELEYEGSLFAGDLDVEFKQRESNLAEQWHIQLRSNLLDLIKANASFTVRDKLEDVLYGVAGLAREKHLRAVLKELHQEGVTQSDSKGKLYDKRVVRRRTP